MKKQNLKSVCDQRFADYPDTVSVAQVQEMLGVSRTFVYNLINDGEILALQIGIRYKIPKYSVIQYLLRQEKDSDLNSSLSLSRIIIFLPTARHQCRQPALGTKFSAGDLETKLTIFAVFDLH